MKTLSDYRMRANPVMFWEGTFAHPCTTCLPTKSIRDCENHQIARQTNPLFAAVELVVSMSITLEQRRKEIVSLFSSIARGLYLVVVIH